MGRNTFNLSMVSIYLFIFILIANQFISIHSVEITDHDEHQVKYAYNLS